MGVFTQWGLNLIWITFLRCSFLGQPEPLKIYNFQNYLIKHYIGFMMNWNEIATMWGLIWGRIEDELGAIWG